MLYNQSLHKTNRKTFAQNNNMPKTIRASCRLGIRQIKILRDGTNGTFDWNNGTVNEIHAAIVPLSHDLIVP